MYYQSALDQIGATLKIVCLLLFCAIATVFQLYYGSDMMYEMRRRKARAYTFTDSMDIDTIKA